MNKLILITIFSFSVISCSSGLEGEGAATAKKEFVMDQFNSIEANCNCDITIIPSEISKIVVESHQNLIDNLELTSKNGDLVIKEKQKVAKYDLYNINIYSTANLNEIELNKQSKMKISGTLKANEFSIEANDQSMIDQTYLDIKDLDLNFSDQTQATITGIAINLDVDATDESQINLSGLQTVDLEFNAEDNAGISIYALKNLSGKATDNAQVNYKGDPNKDTQTHDRAMINKK